MPDTDPLEALGEKLTAALTDAYSSTDPNAALVFLPGGVTVPSDLVQQGVINPAQMQTFLEVNFDSPFVMSPSEGAVHGRDSTHGTLSQIYRFAATSAKPMGSPSDDAWQRMTAEIAAAKRSFDSVSIGSSFACEPDDWPLPANAGYWTTFGSEEIAPAAAEKPPPSSTPPSKLAVSPRIWMLRTAPISAVAAAPQPAQSASASPHLMMAKTVQFSHPVAASTLPMEAMQYNTIPLHPLPPHPAPTPPPPPATSISVELQHQCVTFAYISGGVWWWDFVFLSDTAWYIPGMPRGALLPLPPQDPTAADLAYGLPIGLIIIQGLTVRGNWAGADNITSVGPFSLKGATKTPGADGTISFVRPGMQVIALLCSKLPVLPPVDAPDLKTASPVSASVAAGSGSGAPAENSEASSGAAATSSSSPTPPPSAATRATEGSTSNTPAAVNGDSSDAGTATASPSSPAVGSGGDAAASDSTLTGAGTAPATQPAAQETTATIAAAGVNGASTTP